MNFEETQFNSEYTQKFSLRQKEEVCRSSKFASYTWVRTILNPKKYKCQGSALVIE